MIRPAAGLDVAQIVGLLLDAQQRSPYASIPLNRGKITRAVALNVAQGLSWVRVADDRVRAHCLVELVEGLYGLPLLVVQSVCGDGGFWLLRKVVESARRMGATGVVLATSQTSDDAMVHEMVQRLGGLRTGSTYEVRTWA